MPFDGQVAIVTGAASGIGRACALELARERRARITVVDTAGEETLRETARALEAAGAATLTFGVDVSDYAAAERVVAETRERFGGVHILVTCAGVTEDAPLWKMSEAAWERVIGVNLKGTFNYVRAVAPLMRAERAGKIVTVASVEAMRGRFGISNYAASKAGVIALTRCAAAELGRYNVNVNAVAPGFTRTPMVENLPEELKQRAIEQSLLKRMAEPEDVARIVSFLCSDAARHITGEVVRVDGGELV